MSSNSGSSATGDLDAVGVDCAATCSTKPKFNISLTPLYDKLLQLNNCSLIRNENQFKCFNCNKCIEINDGIVLHNCCHNICERCIKNVILSSEEPEIICPFNDGYVCNSALQHREIKSLTTTDQFEAFLNRSFEKGSNGESADNNFSKLVLLEYANSIENTEKFNCVICLTAQQEPTNGFILRECLHVFCKLCLTSYINNTLGCVIRCPFKSDYGNDCVGILQHREIQSLLNIEQFQHFLKMSIQAAEHMIDNTFHCITPNCTGFTIVEKDDIKYECCICHVICCIPCKASHNGINCDQYISKLMVNKSEVEITKLIQTEQAMRCPKCTAIIMKIEGCDGLRCTLCNIAICWATKGPRWGPAGPGDSSGGCRCKINNKMCTPNCGNCH